MARVTWNGARDLKRRPSRRARARRVAPPPHPQAHHAHTDGAASLARIESTATELRTRASKLRSSLSHRQTDTASLLASIGALDENVRAAELDARNAPVAPGSESEERREKLMAALADLAEEVRALREGAHQQMTR